MNGVPPVGIAAPRFGRVSPSYNRFVQSPSEQTNIENSRIVDFYENMQQYQSTLRICLAQISQDNSLATFQSATEPVLKALVEMLEQVNEVHEQAFYKIWAHESGQESISNMDTLWLTVAENTFSKIEIQVQASNKSQYMKEMLRRFFEKLEANEQMFNDKFIGPFVRRYALHHESLAEAQTKQAKILRVYDQRARGSLKELVHRPGSKTPLRF